MRVLVTGGRHYAGSDCVWAALDALKPDEVIFGDAQGADALALAWCKKRKVPYQCFEADWTEQGPSAGPARNQRMIDMGKPDLVLAFPGHQGTHDCIRRAEFAKIEVRRIDHD